MVSSGVTKVIYSGLADILEFNNDNRSFSLPVAVFTTFFLTFGDNWPLERINMKQTVGRAKCALITELPVLFPL